jgi:glucosamine--fructose-6-phosphate aminotransferase (isomerizing)
MHDMMIRQPESIRTTLESSLSTAQAIPTPPVGRRLLFVGIGTSFHAALAISHAARKALDPRTPIEAVPSFDVVAEPELARTAGAAILFSSSGETWITLRAQEILRRVGVPMVLISGTEKSPSRDLSDFALITQLAEEASWTHTVSYTSALAAGLALVSAWARLEPTAVGSVPAIEASVSSALRLEPAVREFAEAEAGRSELVVLGSGNGEATAREAALKSREAAGIFATASGVEELLHGILPSVSERTIVLGISHSSFERARANEALSAARALGAATRLLDSTDEPSLPGTWKVSAPSAYAAPLSDVVPLQLFAYYSALARKQNPDIMRLDDPKVFAARRSFGI